MINPFKFIAKIKNLILRAGAYLSIINFILIFATFNKTYSLNIDFFALIIVGFIVIIIIGILDYVFIMKHEFEHINSKNDIKQQLNNIEIKLNKFLKKVKEEYNVRSHNSDKNR